MKTLGFDCSAGACSVAVIEGERVLAHRRERMARGHAEALMPMIDAVLAAAGLGPGDLDLLAVTTGPGSFTGIRVGLAAARGLALATARPLIGVTAFVAVAAAVAPEALAGRPLLVAIDSRRTELFLQLFDEAGREAGAAVQLGPAQLAGWVPDVPLLVAGDAAAGAVAALRCAERDAALAEGKEGAATDPPDAIAVAQLAAASWRAGAAHPLPRPFYLRAPDVTTAGESGPSGRKVSP